MTISYSGGLVRLLFRWKGSIWRSVWRELAVWLLLFYLVAGLHRFILPELDKELKWKTSARFERLCRQFDDYTRQIPLTFLLGFYVSNVVSRWWRQFETLVWPEDIVSVLCTVIPGTDERSAKRRHVCTRYLVATCALAWRDVSSKIRARFPTMDDLVHSGLLSQNEMELLEKSGGGEKNVRWMTPLHWVQKILADEVKDNNPMTSLVNNFVSELKLYRSSFRRLYGFDYVNLPLVYTQVAALAVYSFFLLSLLGRQEFGDIGKLSSKDNIPLYFPFFAVIQFLFYVGWFKVGQDLMRPFGQDDDDIELHWILERNFAVAMTISDRLQPAEAPSLDETDPWWKEKEKCSYALRHTDYSKSLPLHPPKLHSYLRMNLFGKQRDEDESNAPSCIAERNKRLLYW